LPLPLTSTLEPKQITSGTPASSSRSSWKWSEKEKVSIFAG
jgi:hypothetical protein